MKHIKLYGLFQFILFLLMRQMKLTELESIREIITQNDTPLEDSIEEAFKRLKKIKSL